MRIFNTEAGYPHRGKTFLFVLPQFKLRPSVVQDTKLHA